MMAPPVPPTSAPSTSPVAVEPVAAPIRLPMAPPDVAPMTAPFVWWLVAEEHPFTVTAVASAATSNLECFIMTSCSGIESKMRTPAQRERLRRRRGTNAHLPQEVTATVTLPGAQRLAAHYWSSQ